MGLNFEYSPYSLKFKKSSREVTGALLRVDGSISSIQAWEHLGDLSLDWQLKALSEKGWEASALLKKSFHWLELDAFARKNEEALLSPDALIPKSHYFFYHWVGCEDFSNKFSNLVENNFSHVKVKINNEQLKSQDFKELIQGMLKFPLKLRIDLNSQSNFESLFGFLKSLDEKELNSLDFIEDPFPFHEAQWEQLQREFEVRFALDFEKSPKFNESFELFIVKAAYQDKNTLIDRAANEMKRIVMTSYLDHPVAQCLTAFEASQAFEKHPLLIDECGLLSQNVYEDNSFSKYLNSEGPDFTLQEDGVGVGFESELKKIHWKKY